jgi:hypothetical protein
MKMKFLAAAAAIAIIASGVVATAQEKQENPKHEQRPAAERVEPKVAPKAEPGAKAAEGERREQPRAEGATNNQPPRTGEAQRTDTPRAAETEQRNAPKAGERRNAAEMDKQNGAAEPRKNDAEQQGGPREERRVGENPDTRNAPKVGEKPDPRNAPRTAQHDEAHGQPRVIGNVKSSQEHATRLREALRGHGQREHAGIDINVGVRVPESVTIYPLPAEVIAIAPEYRGYDYFIDDNDEVVFVSPETHEVVGAIEYEGRAASDESTVNVAGARPCPVEN